MSNNWSANNYTKKINLFTYLQRLIMQWKAVLILACIFSIIVAGAKYYKDTQTYNGQMKRLKEAEEQAKTPKNERIAAVTDALSPAEREAVEVLVGEKELLNNYKTYIRNSIVMKMDPTNQRVLELVYSVNCENDNEQDVILNMYSAFMHGDALVEAIKPEIEPDTENTYIEELISTDGTKLSDEELRSAALDIRIALPEEVNAETVADIIDSGLLEYSKEVKKDIPHTIKQMNVIDSHVFHHENEKKVREICEYMGIIEEKVGITQRTLSENQAAAIDAILSIKHESSNPVNNAKGANSLIKPSINKKSLLLGALFGILLYAMAYLALMLFNGKTSSPDDVGRLAECRMIGEINKENNRKGIKSLLGSKFMNRILFNRKTFPEEQVSAITTAVDAICNYTKCNRIALLDIANSSDNDIQKKVAEAIEKKRIEISVLEGSDIEEKELLEADNLILLTSNNTEEAVVSKYAEVLKTFGLSPKGFIYVNEV